MKTKANATEKHRISYVYLVLNLIDECAWITEKVCLTEEIAQRWLSKLTKSPRNVRLKIEKVRVVKK